ncbi:alpha-N-acetylgalactosaminidase-like [Acanthaster planci]|uniref:Alpha-galactosidase n=1 Tax=Acanthaster planci TaxID=133434 RepID=A0A8B7ZV06_ACAPL|nr:alpha-N-acetylgalactosaminidase-like [Acanthaster planci]XP_022109392.1 alpha-N-acetylgalactosaminidase-like [Acanthaster planci]XP_022109393.1 alpha-N-acetylgalactosaminidase-like [Acanthaster planci]
MRTILLLVSLSLTVPAGYGLDNGLARTPPMGWNAWERFRCNVDCDPDPDNCIREELFMQMADIVVSQGYKEVGYEFINMDDCWMSKERDAQGRLQPDPKRFPSGIKNLADYVHSKGLKFGLYQDMGTQTCDGYPGIWGHIETDVQTYVEWGVDYVKMDGCHNLGPVLFGEGFVNMSHALNKTGRPIVFSCEWGFDMREHNPNYTEIAVYCNSMRQYLDVQDSWEQVLTILNWYTFFQEIMAKVNGPGNFIDMDFIIVGDFALSYEQAQSQMALWSIMSSALLMSSDLRKMDPKMKAILQNREVIAINQDKLGKMGIMIHSESHFEVWTKVLDKGCFAAVIFSRATDMPHNFTTTMTDLGYPNTPFYVRDVINHRNLGIFIKYDPLNVKVNPGGVVMIKAEPVKKRTFKVY